MKFKVSNVSLVLAAAFSVSAMAETITAGSNIVADAQLTVVNPSIAGLTITPVASITTSEIKKGQGIVLGSYDIVDGGSETAVRFVNQDAAYPFCSWTVGDHDATNKVQVCLNDFSAPSFKDGAKTYYKLKGGNYKLIGGAHNADPSMANVKADVYKFSMELVQYTL